MLLAFSEICLWKLMLKMGVFFITVFLMQTMGWNVLLV